MSARTQLIESKSHLVGRALRSFLSANPTYGYLKADLRQEATQALIRAIDRGMTNDGHIVRRLLDRLSEVAPDESSIIRVPPSTRREYKRKGKTLDLPSVRSLTYDPVDQRSGEALQSILECCKNSRERQVIEMLAAGYQQKECAETLGVSPARISQLLKEIEARYDNDEGTATPYEKPQRGDGVTCECGQPVEKRYATDGRCEDCFAEDSQRYHGRCQRANIVGSPVGRPRHSAYDCEERIAC